MNRTVTFAATADTPEMEVHLGMAKAGDWNVWVKVDGRWVEAGVVWRARRGHWVSTVTGPRFSTVTTITARTLNDAARKLAAITRLNIHRERA